MAAKDSSSTTIDLATHDLLLALVTLEVDKRESREADGRIKTELLLSNAGLGYQQIAQIMGKNADAVRMTISRSKPKKTATKERA